MPKTKATSRKPTKCVPYARGFKVPTERDKIRAAGFGIKDVPLEYRNIRVTGGKAYDFFSDIPQPSSIDDWLAQYDEEGQTFSQFINECPWLSSRKIKYMSQRFLPSAQTINTKYPDGKIYIVKVGNFPQHGLVSFDALLDYSQRFLNITHATLPDCKINNINNKLYWVTEPTGGSHVRSSPRTRTTELDTRYDEKTGNIQVQITPLLSMLRQIKPKDALCVIGLTSYDLFAEKSDLFVAGMAAGNQGVAVFSLTRYDPTLAFSQEFWFVRYKVPGFTMDERRHLILQRACKLVVHEICHIMGIDHCIFYECCMNGSGHLAEDFKQPMHLCPVDLHKLQTLCGFDVLTRYRQLLDFYQNYKLEPEAEWVRRRISFLEKNSD